MKFFSHVIEADTSAIKDYIESELKLGEASMSRRGNVVYAHLNNMNQIRIEFEWNDEEDKVYVNIEIKRKHTSLAPDWSIGGEYSFATFDYWMSRAKQKLNELNKRGR